MAHPREREMAAVCWNWEIREEIRLGLDLGLMIDYI